MEDTKMQFSIDYALISKLLELNHFQRDSANSGAYFIAFRGAIPSDSNSWKDFHLKTDLTLSAVDCKHYNCTIIQVLDGKLSPFRGTTLPGEWWCTHTPQDPNPYGVARLLEGHHKLIQGHHKERYPAFKQYGRFPLLRDTNSNLEFNWDTDKFDPAAGVGINLHYGKGDLMKNWSLGCQVVNTDNQLSKWNTFKDRIYSGDPDKKTTYSYYLFNADYVCNFVNANGNEVDKFERLLWGSKGEKVETLQKRLLEIGINFGNPDGDFGPKTMRDGVMAFQKKHISPQKADGIVTDDVWKTIFDSKYDNSGG
jgi:hypothetical protein